MVGVPNAAVRHMVRSITMTALGAPPSHPDLAVAYARLAVIYQSYQHVPMAIACFTEALRYRWDFAAQVQYLHAIALAYASIGSFRDAVNWQSKVVRNYE